jgi:predicted aconitase with swiveling domain
MDPGSGRIVDPHHPQRGTVLSGKIVAMPAGKGSSSSSSVLAEAIRRGTAPAGIVLWQPDGIVALGAIVAAELYGRQCPIVCLVEQDYAQLRSGIPARIAASEEGATIELCS